jgi:hypothetical protein
VYSISLVVYFLAPPVRIEDSDKAEEFNRSIQLLVVWQILSFGCSTMRIVFGKILPGSCILVVVLGSPL